MSSGVAPEASKTTAAAKVSFGEPRAITVTARITNLFTICSSMMKMKLMNPRMLAHGCNGNPTGGRREAARRRWPPEPPPLSELPRKEPRVHGLLSPRHDPSTSKGWSWSRTLRIPTLRTALPSGAGAPAGQIQRDGHAGAFQHTRDRAGGTEDLDSRPAEPLEHADADRVDEG